MLLHDNNKTSDFLCMDDFNRRPDGTYKQTNHDRKTHVNLCLTDFF